MSTGKVALITGINGQDGSYLSELLLERGYTVHGTLRRSSSEHEQLKIIAGNSASALKLHYVDLQETGALWSLIATLKPDEIYNLAGQSQQDASFALPQHTAETNSTGVLRVLEAVRSAGLSKTCRILQPVTSAFFESDDKLLDEHAKCHPKSSYSLTKLFALNLCRVYRESYGMFVSSAIFFNHESPRRKISFASRKVSDAVAKIKFGLQDSFEMANFTSVLDWGHSKDYMDAAWRILNYHHADDFVIATGTANSIRDLCSIAFDAVDIKLDWEEDKAVDHDNGKMRVRRTQNTASTIVSRISSGDSTKARSELGWSPKYSFEDLVVEMVNNDVAILGKQLSSSDDDGDKQMPRK